MTQWYKNRISIGISDIRICIISVIHVFCMGEGEWQGAEPRAHTQLPLSPQAHGWVKIKENSF